MVLGCVICSVTFRATVALCAGEYAELMVLADAVFIFAVYYPAAASALQPG
jgi:hypothetical protein